MLRSAIFLVSSCAAAASLLEARIGAGGEFLSSGRSGYAFTRDRQLRRNPVVRRHYERDEQRPEMRKDNPDEDVRTRDSSKLVKIREAADVKIGSSSKSRNEAAGLEGVQDLKLSQKATGDPRDYKMSELPNGVKVLAIQDRTAQQAAFAASVTAGQFYDPPEFLGLAHLCEHAVFLGTEKYPMRTGFDEFLARHGGSTNAYTAAESTVYYASLDQQALDEALDRFADFFKAPLLNISTVWDEIRAVESEHSKNMNSIQWRTERAMFSLANPQNPIEWFHTGDHESLEGHGQEQLGAALKKYFDENYCPHRLNVVTFGKDAVEKQLEMVLKSFGSMKRRPECKDEPSSFASEAPFKADRLGNWLHIDGANPIPQLWVLFPMENIQPLHRSKPLVYLRRLLTYEGENSLLDALDTKLQLAKSLTLSSDDTSAGSMLWLKLDLTADGLKYPTAVLDTIFAYLAKVKSHGLDQQQLKAVQRDAELEWQWRESADAETTTQDFAELMTRYTPEELLSGDALIQEPSAGVVARMLERLVPENMNVGVAELNPDFNSDWGSREVKTIPHYGSQYIMYPMADAYSENVALWKRWLSSDIGEADIEDELLERLQQVDQTLQELPKMNLPEEVHTTNGPIEMEHAQTMKGKSEIEQVFGEAPKQVIGSSANSSEQLFYRHGWMVPGPRVQAKFFLRPKMDPTSRDSETPLSRILNTIGIDLLGKNLRGRLAKHLNSGTSYSLSAAPDGINLGVLAFKNDLEDFAKQVLLEVERGVSAPQKMFDRAWADLNQRLNICEGPLIMAGKAMDILLRTNEFDEYELLDSLENGNHDVSRSAVEKYMANLWNGSFALTSIIFGDISETDAKKVSKEVMLQLGSLGTRVDVGANEVEHVPQVVKPSAPLEFRSMNPCAHNSNHIYRTRVFIGSPTVQQRVLLDVLKPVLKELTFSELRTKSGLGYIVGSDVTPMSNVLTLECFVQGEAMMPDDLELQCERVWSKSLPERIANMSVEEFESLKASYRAELLSPTNGHDQELNHFSSALLMGKCGELDAEMLQFLESVKSKDELLAEWRATALPEEGEVRTRISVKYFGHGSHMSRGNERDVPSPEQVAHKAKLLGLDGPTIERLSAERAATAPLYQANSGVRKALERSGGFFGEELYCKASEKKKADRAAADGKRKRSKNSMSFGKQITLMASLLELGINTQGSGHLRRGAPRPELPAFQEQGEWRQVSSLRPFRPRAVASLERISVRAGFQEEK
jgi:secreted Zn-dependent insulinase-like peptidase